MKKKMFISSGILFALVIYRILGQWGIKIENANVLLIVTLILLILVIYDFINKFKIWLDYSEKKDQEKEIIEENVNQECENNNHTEIFETKNEE